MKNSNIIRAYDVRGIYPQEVNIEVIYEIAYAYFSIVKGKNYVIGYDMRESSLEFHNAFVRAGNDLEKNIDSIGMVTTDMMYFAVGKYNYDGGVIITASHNPPNYNGVKMVEKEVKPIDMDLLKKQFLTQDITAPADLTTKTINFNSKNYKADYDQHLLSLVDTSVFPKLNIVIDAGNGMGGRNIETILEKLSMISVDKMFFEPNAEFPHHEANPSLPENLLQLSNKVVENSADLGIAFDGDADRVAIIDKYGEKIKSFELSALFINYYLKKDPNSLIVYDRLNTYVIENELKKHNGKGIKSRTGHNFFKNTLRNENAIFGGESSGHYYFKDIFNADNGAFPILLLFQILGETKQSLEDLVSKYRTSFFSSVETNFLINTNTSKEFLIDLLKSNFTPKLIDETDGIVMEFENWRFNARFANNEPMLRINIEALSLNQLEESKIKIFELLASHTTIPGLKDGVSINDQNLENFNTVLDNIWYTWNPHHILPIIDLYGDGWRKNTPPKEFTSHYGVKKLYSILENNSFVLKDSIRLLNNYLTKKDKLWFDNFTKNAKNNAFIKLYKNPIAYFSMEYGFVDWLQIYSGGLGVLGADFIKEASDMGVPIVAVGLFYSQGYFHQEFNDKGEQKETYITQNPKDYPLEQVLDFENNPLEIEIEIIDHIVYANVWKLKVGRREVYLLDTNIEKNQLWEDRMITAHLYGGDEDTRIRQEILLGIGGVRLFDKLNVKPSIYHMNEGHSGFLVLELAISYIKSGLNFEEAISKVDEHLVFTNHTLKEAGNDIFSHSLVTKYLSAYIDNLETDINSIFKLGQQNESSNANFSMTLLGLRNAKVTNAVSKLHSVASKRIWPEYNLIPITNGVHAPTWVSPELHLVFDKYIGEKWHDPSVEIDFNKVFDIPEEVLWQVHQNRKKKLINTLNTELGLNLSEEALTIAWSRRLTAYKRPEMILANLERLENLVSNDSQPVQILIAGKAHPRDGVGKKILQEMCQTIHKLNLKNKVEIIPGYNWQLARRMVSGADIWLNTPYRYEEASGTSGMKACLNGVLQLTTKDGWTDEVDWKDKGWVIEEDNPVETLHDILEYKVVPLFFDNSAGEFNHIWLDMMKNSIQHVLQNYTTTRMLTDYLNLVYRKIID